jgi:hypothetical protein
MAIDRIPGVGPQNSDIATAVAAPSAATIAAAVAAPSAATIASTVAGSVPTLAQITSTVQSNAGSPFGGTWTNLSSYKYLRFTFYCQNGVGTWSMPIRFNNDGNANYRFNGLAWPSNPNSGAYSNKSLNGSNFNPMQFHEAATNAYCNVILEIFAAQSAAPKPFRALVAYPASSGYDLGYTYEGTWYNTAAISNVVFTTTRASSNEWSIYSEGAA